MFIYLSKKIAIPNNVQLKSLSWNGEEGWIACGGENGMLKVLKLDAGGAIERQKGGAGSNLSMNQTLEGHGGSAVMRVTWNEGHRKLTTSDQAGMIIVWMLHKGMWYEEMINNRNVSTVTDMKWSRDGQRICIAYQDGHVIVGSVDGNRLWGKELGTELSLLEWAPDGKSLLFATPQHTVQVHDAAGNFARRLGLCTDGQEPVPIVGLEWFDVGGARVEQGQPSLAVGFANGTVQLMRGEADETPVVVETGLAACVLRWNGSGSLLAVGGTLGATSSAGEARQVAAVLFLSPHGARLRSLKVPGSAVASLSFEGRSLRLAMCVDSFIFFAALRPAHAWAPFGSHLACAHPAHDRPGSAVLFLDCESGQRATRHVGKLLHVLACASGCALVTAPAEAGAPCRATLCSGLGSPLDARDLPLAPECCALSGHHLIAASATHVYAWQYRTLTGRLTSLSAAGSSSLRRREGREACYHVDDLAAGGGGGGGAGGGEEGGLERELVPSDRPTSDPIVAVCATERCLYVARASGALLACALPHVALQATYQLQRSPARMHVNCDGTRLAVLDAGGALCLHSLERQPEGEGQGWGWPLPFERKDVWDFCWAQDEPDSFALMEKAKMHVFRGLEQAEEPVPSAGYLRAFAGLEVRTAQLDELGARPDAPLAELCAAFRTQPLREAEAALAGGPLSEALAYVEAHPHPRLWRLLCEGALSAAELDVAEAAAVACADYPALQLLKRLRRLDEPGLLGAEVHAHYGRFDEAEAAYLALDRRDLALNLRARLGDWARVLALGADGGAQADALLAQAHGQIGAQLQQQRRHAEAAEQFALAKDAAGLAACCYALGDFRRLAAVGADLPDGSALLLHIGERLASVGLAKEAALALSRGGDTAGALRVCAELGEWEGAVALGEQHGLADVDRQLGEAAAGLLAQGRVLLAAQLYRRAARPTEAASLFAQLARADAAAGAPPLRVKRLYVLSALQVEAFRKRALDGQRTHTRTAQTTAQTLAGLMTDDATTGGDKPLDSPWRGAEAYHFLALAQRQLHAGDAGGAMRTAQRLREYEKLLGPEAVHSLLALAAFHARFYGTCSKALSALQSLQLPAPQAQAYEGLALAIFTRVAPDDPGAKRHACAKCQAVLNDWSATCGECGAHYQACVASGRALVEPRETWRCRTCKHRAFEHEMGGRANCPLCHAPVDASRQAAAAAAARRPADDPLAGRH